MKIHNSKRVLITGAASGIGRAIALRFAEKGWNLVCHYCSSQKKAVELKRLTEKMSIECRLFRADFSSRRDVESFIRKIKKIRIDSLINNAATYIGNKHFSKLRLDEIEDIFMVNIFTPILLTSNIFSAMKRHKFGRIVNISSIAAKYGGSSYSLAYGCSKLALEGMAKTLAKEGSHYNVLVNTIRPGVINTEFHKKFPKDMKRRIAMVPLKRIGTPADIADAAYYLGSGKNNFITNEIFTVAGGE